MSGNLYLNWAIMAVSLFNALLLIWLGLTVLLNSDRRAWGIWIASAGLLLGGLFFISHSAIYGLFVEGYILTNTVTIISEGLLSIGWNMAFWWTVGLFPAIMLPFAWYVVMLWYGGFWTDRQSTLYKRQHLWFAFVVVLLVLGLAGLFVGLLLLAIPSRSLVNLRLLIRWSIAGIPLMALGYSAYVILCISLSLDALRRPGPSQRVMGSIARHRARPWLVAASIALLIVSLMVAAVLVWLVQDSRQRIFIDIFIETHETLARLDFVISLLISTVTLLVGQAVVSYEVFTGKTLPRRGLLRHWHRAILLSGVMAVLVSATLIVRLRPLYSLILVALLISVFYAIFSWRTYAERERYMEQLRPFVSSQRLIDQLLAKTDPQIVDIKTPFLALCKDVLDTEVGFLTAVGPLSSLVGPPLTFPQVISFQPDYLNLVDEFKSPHTQMKSLNPAEYGGAIWAVPLWSERGLIGLFLLGRKHGGGLYSQEEIEIARVSGERLIDTQASAAMAQRLMALQRERLAQSQIIDQQTRRVLHDDILPNLQASLIALNQNHEAEHITTAVTLMTEAHKQISDLLRDMPTITVPDIARLGLVRALQRSVTFELADTFDEIFWQLDEGVAEKVKTIPSLTAEVVFYAAREAMRNAAKYGRGTEETRPLHLWVSIGWSSELCLQIRDDGVGLQESSVSAGSGQGLALHSTMMAVVGGTMELISTQEEGTTVTIILPAT